MSGRHRFLLPLLLLWFAVSMPAAHAHASLVSCNPAVDAILSKLPLHIEVEFDGNLITFGNAKSNVLQVLDAQGQEIDAGNSRVAGPILGVDVKDQSEQGVFTVRWRVVSSDGHPVEGSYQFTVGSNVGTVASTVIAHGHSESFWSHHRGHIYVLIAALAFIGIWASFERRRRLSE